MKMKIKRIIKSIMFLVIFALLFNQVSSYLWMVDTSISGFFDEKESIDVVYVGSSSVYRQFNAPLAFEEEGFTTGMLTSSAQPFSAVTGLIDISRESQDADLYIIDFSTVMFPFSKFDEGHIRQVVDSVPFSSKRVDLIDYMLKYAPDDGTTNYEYYFSFLKYHNSWKEITKSNSSNLKLYKGYCLEALTTQTEKQERRDWNDKIEIELYDDYDEVIADLINYIERENIKVLFVIPAKYYSDEDMGRINSATKIFKENNYDIINFNYLVDEIGIDYNTDYYDSSHLNADGAAKFTRYFSRYLSETYNLDNHKGDDSYSSWEEEFERFKQSYKRITGNDFR